jgi:predicted dehydrogenase
VSEGRDAVRIGVVGMNYWGPNLARNFARLPGAELAWCCDLDEALLDRHRSAYPTTRFTTSLDDLLTDPDLDAVVVATPVPTHARLALLALEAGKHVVVEAAESRGLALMVDHLLVYHPGVQRLKALVDEGTLGQVFYLYGNRQNLGIVRPDENALWSLGPHDISVMLYLVGERPVEVMANGRSYLQPDVEDVVFGQILFPSGVLGHLHLSWLDPHKMRKLTVIGSDKMAVFDDMETERKVTVYDKGPVPRTETYGEYIQVRSGDIHIPKIPGDEPLRLVCEHFARCVADGIRPLADGHAGLVVVEVLEAMSESLRDAGRPVRLGRGVTA